MAPSCTWGAEEVAEALPRHARTVCVYAVVVVEGEDDEEVVEVVRKGSSATCVQIKRTCDCSLANVA